MTHFELRLCTINPNVKDLYKEKIGMNSCSDSGFDLFIVEDITLPPQSTTKIDFQISSQVIMFDNYNEKYSAYWLVPRSSVVKTKIRLANSMGLIDSGYTGNICAFVDNIGTEPIVLKHGERWFQLANPMLQPFHNISFVEQLAETKRGSGGFGSTGK
jgi:dUTP pyrophosphatase